MNFEQQLHREHARRRAKERLGIKLTRNRLAAVVADIRGGRATRLERETSSPTRDIYMVKICGVSARVVYCSRIGQVITVMRRGITL